MKRKSMTIVIVMLLITILLSYFSVKLPNRLSGTGFEINGEHQQVLSQIQQDFNVPQQSLYIVFDNKNTDEINQILAYIKNHTKVKTILPIETNRHYAYATLLFDLNEVQTSQEVVKINHYLEHTQGVMLTGNSAANVAINDISQQDLKQAELIGVPIALIILILALGSLMSAMLPIIIGMLTIISTFGILYLTHQHSTLSIYVLNIVPMIGLALSIDFCLLFINRYQIERQHRCDQEAIKITIKTSGEAILFSAICVAIGLSALSLINIPLFRDLALGSAIVIICALLYVFICLPCLLYLLGDKINLCRVPWLAHQNKQSTIWHTFANYVMKHPIKIALLTISILVVSLIPVKNMMLTLPAEKSLPSSHQVRVAQDILSQYFKVDNDKQLYLLIKNEEHWQFNQQHLRKIKNIQETLTKEQMISDVTTIFTVTKTNDITRLPREKAELIFKSFVHDHYLMIPIQLKMSSDHVEARQWVRQFNYPNMTKSGSAQFKSEIFHEINIKIIPALSIIFGMTLLILAFVFRSIILPIKAIIMNVSSLGATFGILIWLFQEGHLGLEMAPLTLVIPVIVFSLVFGLSMDYEVFLITSIKEYYYKGNDNKTATLKGLASTSKIITSAALIMIVVTGAFAFTSIVPVKQLGVGIALAIFIDATLIRLLLVPSLMQLMGDWNWWHPFKRNK